MEILDKTVESLTQVGVAVILTTILVTLVGAEAKMKAIDFGITKITFKINGLKLSLVFPNDTYQTFLLLVMTCAK